MHSSRMRTARLLTVSHTIRYVLGVFAQPPWMQNPPQMQTPQDADSP